MTPIQIIALIFCVVVAIKILVVIFSPKAWMKFAKGMWKNPMFGIIYFILLVIVFYFLIKEVSVVQILAVSAFLALLMGLQLSRYSKDTMDFAQKLAKNKKDLWKKNWFYVLIWVALIVWGLIEIL
jgi:hypothetical protein